MSNIIRTISPVDGSVFVERPLANKSQIKATLAAARAAQLAWRETTLEQRATVCRAVVQWFVSNQSVIAEEITHQMGRPIRYTPGEINGLVERANHMISLAADALADITPEPIAGFRRYIRREPVGVVFTVAPWNYPLLTTVNSVIPAIMAGNAVVIKPSAQTPLTAERFAQAFASAGAPDNLLSVMFLDHQTTSELLQERAFDFCCFTGSVAAGRKIERSAAGSFAGVALELGGKDPAYVRQDADIAFCAEQLVDGAFFNSGQSCCGIERIYVDERLFDDFVEAFRATVGRYQLGNPLDDATTLGPMVRSSAAAFVREQIEQAINAGAKPLIDSSLFVNDAPGTPYLAPQVLVNVDHSMRVMSEESFGPVVGIMPVKNDKQALGLMNDSDLGLTATIWTKDVSAAESIGQQLQTGTVFMNRCDYLDPALVWTGVKNTGRGYSLSQLGFHQLTQAKSFHLKL